MQISGKEIARGQVRDEWIDINEHMNVAYYVLAFDLAIDALWARFGVDEKYIRDGRGSTFAVECHVTYQRELRRGDPYLITSQILAYDAKRIHQFLRMYHGAERYLAATAEWMNLHVDMKARRVAPWPADILSRIGEVVSGQGEWAWPDEAGRRMAVPEPLFTAEAAQHD